VPKLLKKKTVSSTVNSKNWDKIQEALLSHDVAGKLTTILVVNETKKLVTCYSHAIDNSRIFKILGLNVKWAIRNEIRSHFEGCEEGFFVLLQVFEPNKDDDWYVAIVGIEPDPEAKFFPFRI